MHSFCILQYSYPHGDDCKIRGQPHKNSKEKSPFNRSKKSVLVKIESEVQKSAQPTNVYNRVFQECGGVESASSCGSLPRNRKQIANIKQKALRGTQSEKDQLFSVMEECKKEQSQVDPFLRIVQAAPDAMCLLVSDRQLHDVARFCTCADQCSILGIDPTFNLGEFSVTVTTYRHLQLIERRTRKPPVLLGPLLIHQKKTRESYYFLASGIVGLCPSLRGLVAFGTDGEKAIGEAFQMQFGEAKHLLCFIHVKDRLKSKLRDLGICGDVANSFLTDIFGYQQGTHKFCGLVDCESPEKFDEELQQLELVWNSREMFARGSNKAEFYDWFLQYHASNMKEKMLRPLREAVGLGRIPNEYTNNANESANARIKAKVDYKKSELTVFCKQMKELVDSQTQDIEKAFTMDTGPFAVAAGYHQYRENPRKWVKESTSYRQKAISRIHKIKLLPHIPSELNSSSLSDSGMHSSFNADSSLSSLSSGNCDVSAADVYTEQSENAASNSKMDTNEKENVIPLSVSWEDVGLAKEVFSSMWDKAASLVVNEKGITDAPGLSNSKMVVSSSNPRKPHLVSLLDKGKVTCDCINYTNKSLCSHTLAVAEKSGLLMELLQWYTRTNKTANLWSLARSSDVPKHPGAKPSGNKRKRSRFTNPQVKTCSKLSTTSAKKWQSQTDHQSQSSEAPQPSPFSSSTGSAYWTSGSSQSHSTYTGPSHWSYSAGPSQVQSTYTGPSCWSAGPLQPCFTRPLHWGEFSPPFQLYPYGPYPLPPVPDSYQFQQPSIPPQFPTGDSWSPFHSTASPPQSCSDVTKTRNGMRNGTIHGMSQFLWKRSFITVLLLQQHINHCSTNNSRIHRLRPPFQRFQRHDTVRAALKSCILVDSKVALLGPICLPNWTSSLAVTTLRHNKAITSLHASSSIARKWHV